MLENIYVRKESIDEAWVSWYNIFKENQRFDYKISKNYKLSLN